MTLYIGEKPKNANPGDFWISIEKSKSDHSELRQLLGINCWQWMAYRTKSTVWAKGTRWFSLEWFDRIEGDLALIGMKNKGNKHE